MNRFHVHLNVADLEASIRFYTALFGAGPKVLKDDYAKWLLDDPRVNFAVSRTGRAPGVDHLGLEADDAAGLAEFGARLDTAGGRVLPEADAHCCYARSDKFWTEDPQGTRWETFHTHGEAATYHGGPAACAGGTAACAPTRQPAAQPVGVNACCAGSDCC
ncbi:ArsI/CadI family heavy metal resistance metalloenzyme [Pseudoxanthomonas suwonensis]|uniref:Glyoxalase n=1 Tax=Pseudoxanthomonas suwonensis TaxID=314722 RepID=A0A0E3Z4H0_9GAMM|nr:ArsI/CadI family heavy metal resistance metalloenzyme [Pseudoxanthomonas suwonensis]AKC87959.1 glyoxalase [Pseudoxanthomonas suwonensis]